MRSRIYAPPLASSGELTRACATRARRPSPPRCARRGEGDDKGVQQTTPVFRSESIKASDAGCKGWRRADLQAERLCRCEDDRPIVIEVHRYRGNGQHVRLGSATTTMAALLVGDGAHDLPLRNDSGGQAGSLALSRVALYEANTFLQYVRGGCEICLSAAIDFTASNKSPADPRSLHFWDPKVRWRHAKRACACTGPTARPHARV